MLERLRSCQPVHLGGVFLIFPSSFFLLARGARDNFGLGWVKG